MKEVIIQVDNAYRIVLTEVDISHHPDLEQRWGTEIPVLLSGQRVIARHRISALLLAKEINRITSP